MAGGNGGIAQTLAVMRRYVNEGRVNLTIRQAATTAAFLVPEKDELAEVHAIFEFVRDRIRYVRDIHNVETLSTPEKTLAGRIGDCDDQTTLLAAMLESIGYPTRFIVAGYNEPGVFEHVYLQVFAGGEWIAADATEACAPLGWEPGPALTYFVERI